MAPRSLEELVTETRALFRDALAAEAATVDETTTALSPVACQLYPIVVYEGRYCVECGRPFAVSPFDPRPIFCQRKCLRDFEARTAQKVGGGMVALKHMGFDRWQHV